MLDKSLIGKISCFLVQQSSFRFLAYKYDWLSNWTAVS